jgi:hypothetical protein
MTKQQLTEHYEEKLRTAQLDLVTQLSFVWLYKELNQ